MAQSSTLKVLSSLRTSTQSGTVFGSGSNFAEIKLTGSTAKGHTISFKKAVFERGCHFVGADFGDADFERG